MKYPLTWLKDYVDIDVSARELADKLFSAGFEVEEIVDLGKGIDKVVTAKILSMDKHPEADRLNVCAVDAGEKVGVLQIVTAATNVKAGDVVALALDGATLPDGTKIKSGKLRGAVSQGMMCGGSELGLTDADYTGASVDGVLILHEEDCAPLGRDVKEIFGLNEILFDVSLTANRPDCQSIYGLAREIAAILKKPLKSPATDYVAEQGKASDHIRVKVENSDLCRRYMASYVEDVKIQSSPEWMQKRLRLCGLRPINAIVDVTNFVLLELGNPMHSFDYTDISGSEIVVRNARAGEKIVTLDGKENALEAEMLVICDKERPLAVAGIMGGANSGIRPETKSVVFEVAKFARDSVRRTSRKLGLRSDSSARFEKGVDAASCAFATARALHLVQELGCGRICGAPSDACFESLEPKKMQASVKQINALLGIEVPAEEMKAILLRLGFGVALAGDTLDLTVPLWREDVDGTPDIAEEVIRSYGYEHVVPTVMPSAENTNGGMNERQKSLLRLKNALIGAGLNECMTYSFVNPKIYAAANLPELEAGSIRLLNPLSEDISVMRRAIFPSLLSVAAHNLSKKVEEGRLFEVARVYEPKAGESLPEERETLAILCFGGGADFFGLKGFVENALDAFGIKYDYRRAKAAWLHPGISAEVFARGQSVGAFGEVHPDVLARFGIRQKVFCAQLDAEKLLAFAEKKFVFRDIPVYQDIKRDLAFVVREDIPAADILKEIRRAAGSLLESAEVFDVYRGANIEKGFVSLAFALSFRAKDRTLKYEDVNGEIDAIMKAVSKKFDVKLRG